MHDFALESPAPACPTFPVIRGMAEVRAFQRQTRELVGLMHDLCDWMESRFPPLEPVPNGTI